MWKSILGSLEIGSEGGEVILDEEYNGGCRITLEKCRGHYAITCGVYGAMCHTAFAGEEDCLSKYNAMKNELQKFMDKETTLEEENEFYKRFINTY